jgi:hypothetical protein
MVEMIMKSKKEKKKRRTPLSKPDGRSVLKNIEQRKLV